MVRRNVHAVVRVRGHRKEKVRMNVLTDGVESDDAGDVAGRRPAMEIIQGRCRW